MSLRDCHSSPCPLVRWVKIAALALFAVGTLFSQTSAAQPQYVAAQGRIVPEGGVIAVAASHDAGTPIVGALEVSVGDTVKEGHQLATLSTLPALNFALFQAQTRMQIATDAIDTATLAEQTSQARLKAAVADVALAEQGVAEALAAQEVAEKTLTETTAQMQAQQARLSGTWAENQRILDKDSPPAREAAQIRFEQKMLDLQKAELATSNAGTTTRLQAQIEQTRAAVETARQRVATAQAAQEIARIEAERAKQGIQTATAEQEVAKYALGEANARVKNALIQSPITGTVLQINARVGEAVPMEGLLLIANLEKLYAEAEVYINDLRFVKIGQKAKITGEAFEGEISGTVERIGNMVTLAEIFARDPASFTDRSVVRVRVRLDGYKGGAALPSPLPINSRLLVRIERD